MQKSQKNKKNLMDVFPCSFPISCIKKGGKNIIVFIFAIRGDGKSEINYFF